MNDTVYRVVCPDGHASGIRQYRTLEEALDSAAECDRMHDPVLCDAPHTIQSATWTSVEVSA